MTLKLVGLTQGYGSTPLIRDLDLELEPGIVGLLGPNGAGKTTLLRTMATIMPPRSGSVIVDGIRVTGEKSAREARKRIGYLPQSFGADPSMTVLDFIRYGAWLRGMKPHTWTAAAERALEKVDLAEHARTKMRKISGGMRQRAGIAWAILGEPRLVLLDEPTVGLDPRQRLQFRKAIAELSDCVVVLSTHLTDDVEAVCNRVMVLREGVAVFHGPSAALAARARADLPGSTAMERAYMGLMPEGQQIL